MPCHTCPLLNKCTEKRYSENCLERRHIKLLSALTKVLPDVPIGTPPSVKYIGIGGDWVGHALWWENDVAVQICTAPKGVVLSEHIHPTSIEFLIIYRGSLLVEDSTGVTKYCEGECVKFSLGQSHRVTTLEECSIVAITVPAEENYPHGS